MSKVVNTHRRTGPGPAAPRPQPSSLRPSWGPSTAPNPKASDTAFLVLPRPKIEPKPVVVPEVTAPTVGPPPETGPTPLRPLPPAALVARGPQPVDPYGFRAVSPEELHADSTRVYAVLMALVLGVCLALLSTVLLMVTVVVWPTPEVERPLVDQSLEPSVYGHFDEGYDDEYEFVDEPEVIRTRKPTTGKGTRPPPKKVDPVPPSTPPPVAAGDLTIRIPTGVFASEFEVTCPSGYRERGKFNGGVAVLPGVPVDNCRGLFKGGSINNKLSIRNGGGTLTCTTVNASTLACS